MKKKVRSRKSLSRKSTDGMALDRLIRGLGAAYETLSGIEVTPDNCEESPTVQALVNAIAMRISTLPVHVYLKTISGNRTTKELQPNHPVERLLKKPNPWQTAPNYWLDATSWLVRWGRYHAFKARGVTGPILRLIPIHPGSVEVEQDKNTLNVFFRVTQLDGKQRDFQFEEMHYARGRAKDGVKGDSPVTQAREAIALEIAAQRFGASFFGNGAMPFMVFKYLAGARGTDEQRKQFIQDFQVAYGKGKRFRAMLLPPGIDAGDPVAVENEKAQFLQTRQLQRTIICGAFGVPPHLAGDLTKMTFNSSEQQSIDLQQAVILPYVRIFEAAMERDLLTDEDRRGGIIIRFNLDASLRASFKERQDGLKIMRENGVINPNEWREREGMNPRDGGEEYWEQGPSGQGTPAAAPAAPAPEEDDNDDAT
jgi:HK97 family phage portal protein